MWDLPRPGLEPLSPELADTFLTTATPGKPQRNFNGCILLILVNLSVEDTDTQDMISAVKETEIW